MKAKELSRLLLEHPDFDVKFSFSERDDNSGWGVTVRKFDIDEKNKDHDFNRSKRNIFAYY